MSIQSDLNKQIIESFKIFYQQIDRELASKAIQLNYHIMVIWCQCFIQIS